MHPATERDRALAPAAGEAVRGVPVRLASPRRGPVYRVETDRLVARCWAPTDAALLRAALDDNDQHLRPWIPWMRDEPKPIEETLRWLRRSRAAFDSDSEYRYGLFEPGEQRLVGEASLFKRVGPNAREIGYWIDRHLVGRGLATEAAAAMVRVAFEIDRIERVEIHHAADNTASRAVPERLGFTLDATLRRRAHDADDVVRDLAVWTLFADEYPESPASRVTMFAHDATGAALPLDRSS